MPVKELTKAEKTVMQLPWQLNEVMVKDVVGQMPEPKPAYDTVLTVVQVLESKGFINHKAYSNVHAHFPFIRESDYQKFTLDNLIGSYFSNYCKSLVSFIANDKKLDLQQPDELIKLINDLNHKKK